MKPINFRNLNKLHFRETKVYDIQQMHHIRKSVKENILLNPNSITDADYQEFITVRGKGWVCENENLILGFSIVDIQDRNVWALFVHPDYEGNGIGKKLQEMMLNWYFNQTTDKIWLGTDPKTRAEMFYRKTRWTEIGILENGEIKFEMTLKNWKIYNT